MDKLIELLSQNARFTNSQLAVMLGRSEETIKEQIKKLEDDGVIKGYSAILNESLADKNTIIAYIELKVTPERDSGFDDIARTIMMYDEVDAVSLVSSGTYDLSVTVKGKDFKDIALFVAQRLSTIAGVLSTSTHFVLKTYKEKGIFIEDEEADERDYIAP